MRNLRRREVYFPSADLFSTRYTKETHCKNSTYRTFCLSDKTRAGGNSVISFKLLSLPPAPLDKFRSQAARIECGGHVVQKHAHAISTKSAAKMTNVQCARGAKACRVFFRDKISR